MLRNHIPVEVRHHGFKRTSGGKRQRVFVGEKFLESAGKIVHVSFFKRESGMMNRLEIFRNVGNENGEAVTHGFEHDEWQTFRFRRMHIELGMSKNLRKLFSFLKTEKADVGIARGLALEVAEVGVGEAWRADNDKFGKRLLFHRARKECVGGDQIVQTFVGNNSADVQQVSSRLKPELRQVIMGCDLVNLGAVGNVDDFSEETLAAENLERVGYRNTDMGKMHGRPLAEIEIDARQQTPLGMKAILQMECNDDVGSSQQQARNPSERGGADAVIMDNIVGTEKRMQRRKKRVRDRLEILCIDCREIDDVHAFDLRPLPRHSFTASIH